jgi:hypothetical protein
MTASPLAFLCTDDEPREMPILHPRTGATIRCKDGKPAYILVHGVQSSVGDAVTRGAFERAKKEGKRRGSDGPSYEEARELQRENTAQLIAGWRLVHPQTGEVQDYPYTPRAALELMASPNIEWLRKQIDDFASDPGNFMPG